MCLKVKAVILEESFQWNLYCIYGISHSSLVPSFSLSVLQLTREEPVNERSLNKSNALKFPELKFLIEISKLFVNDRQPWPSNHSLFRRSHCNQQGSMQWRIYWCLALFYFPIIKLISIWMYVETQTLYAVSLCITRRRRIN